MLNKFKKYSNATINKGLNSILLFDITRILLGSIALITFSGLNITEDVVAKNMIDLFIALITLIYFNDTLKIMEKSVGVRTKAIIESRWKDEKDDIDLITSIDRINTCVSMYKVALFFIICVFLGIGYLFITQRLFNTAVNLTVIVIIFVTVFCAFMYSSILYSLGYLDDLKNFALRR